MFLRRFPACFRCPSVRDSWTTGAGWFNPPVFWSNRRNRTSFSEERFTCAAPRDALLLLLLLLAFAPLLLLDSPWPPELFAFCFFGGILSNSLNSASAPSGLLFNSIQKSYHNSQGQVPYIIAAEFGALTGERSRRSTVSSELYILPISMLVSLKWTCMKTHQLQTALLENSNNGREFYLFKIRFQSGFSDSEISLNKRMNQTCKIRCSIDHFIPVWLVSKNMWC